MKPPLFYRMFHYDRAKLPNQQLAKLEQDTFTIEEARQRTGATIGYPGWGFIYHLLLCHLDRSRYEVVVETGSNWGCSTIVLAQALVDADCRGRVITFEIDKANAEKARQNVEAAGLTDRVEFHSGDSRRLLGDAVKDAGPVRTAFLDASHLVGDVMKEFAVLLPVLTDDAVVIFDNTYRIAEEHENQRVNGALKLIQKEYGGNLINFEYCSWYTPGLALWQRRPNL